MGKVTAEQSRSIPLNIHKIRSGSLKKLENDFFSLEITTNLYNSLETRVYSLISPQRAR